MKWPSRRAPPVICCIYRIRWIDGINSESLITNNLIATNCCVGISTYGNPEARIVGNLRQRNLHSRSVHLDTYTVPRNDVRSKNRATSTFNNDTHAIAHKERILNRGSSSDI